MKEINSILKASLPIKRPTKKQMNWSQAKKRYPKMNPLGDVDNDSFPNLIDCKPFDKNKQDNIRLISPYNKKAQKYKSQIYNNSDRVTDINSAYGEVEENGKPFNLTSEDKKLGDPRIIVDSKTGKVVGSVKGYSRNSIRNKKEYKIDDIEIDNRYRKKGYGTKAVIGLAKEHGQVSGTVDDTKIAKQFWDKNTQPENRYPSYGRVSNTEEVERQYMFTANANDIKQTHETADEINDKKEREKIHFANVKRSLGKLYGGNYDENGKYKYEQTEQTENETEDEKEDEKEE